MDRGFFVGLLAAAFAVALWGIQLPVAMDAFAILDPFHMTSIRYAIPACLMLALLALIEGRQALSYRGALIPATVLGVIGLSCSPLLVFVGMAMSQAEHAAVIIALQPSIAAIALWLLHGLRPANFTIGCMCAAFLGVVLVVTKGQILLTGSPRQLAGDVIVLLGASCWVVYTIGTGRLSGWSTWRITVLTMIPGAIATVTLTAGLVAIGYLRTPTPAQLLSVGWELAYLSIAGVIIAMLAWNFGNRRIGPQNSTLLINLLPVATFVFRALQGHRFKAVEILGATLVVAALVTNNVYLRARHVHGMRAQSTSQ